MPSVPGPFEANNAAMAADPWKRHNSTMPKRQHEPPGTGSFMRFTHNMLYLIDLFTDTCQVDPFIFAETLFATETEAFFSIFEPDLKELHHIATGKSLVCNLKQDIKDGTKIENKFWNGATKTLFRASEIVDLAVWRLFIAAVLAEGLVDATSMAQQMSGCSGSANPFSSGNAFGAVPDINQGYSGNGLDWITGDPIFPAFTAQTWIRPGHNGYIAWCCELGPNHKDSAPYTCFLENTVTGEATPEERSRVDADGKIHPVVMKLHRQNNSKVSENWVIRARMAEEMPSGEGFFIRGYCASSDPYGF